MARSASRASISTHAAAPSASCEALPAVTNLSCPITGARLARPSAVVDGRLQLSALAVTSSRRVAPLALSVISMAVRTAMISASKRPSRCAAAVSCWLRRAKASWSSRLMP
ncbi:hypothetical protein D3C87_1709730 [compost metagenome]